MVRDGTLMIYNGRKIRAIRSKMKEDTALRSDSPSPTGEYDWIRG
jgi:hypothetical protein